MNWRKSGSTLSTCSVEMFSSALNVTTQWLQVCWHWHAQESYVVEKVVCEPSRRQSPLSIDTVKTGIYLSAWTFKILLNKAHSNKKIFSK